MQLSFVHFETLLPVQAPVNWRLLQDETKILSGVGSLPLVLDPGTYLVEANIGGITTAKSFTVADQGQQQVQIPFDQGQINLQFTNMDRRVEDAGFYWTLHALNQNDQTAVGTLVASGSADETALVVPAGTYRLEGFLGNDSRIRDLEVEVAGRISGHLNFSAGLLDLTTDLGADQGLAQGFTWQIEKLIGTQVQFSQTINTQAGALLYALEPGRYRITVRAGDRQQTAIVSISAGATTSAQME